jgi:hypothetical protein
MKCACNQSDSITKIIDKEFHQIKVTEEKIIILVPTIVRKEIKRGIL